MVFSINPTAEKTQAMFQSMAISQNGTGEATPITGGTGPGGAAPAPPPPANAEQPKAPGTSGTPSPGTSEAPSPPAAGGEGAGGAGGAGGATPGQGTVGTDGSCTCVVACNAGGFPAAAQGAGAFGGFAGELHNLSDWLEVSKTANDRQVLCPPPWRPCAKCSRKSGPGVWTC